MDKEERGRGQQGQAVKRCKGKAKGTMYLAKEVGRFMGAFEEPIRTSPCLDQFEWTNHQPAFLNQSEAITKIAKTKTRLHPSHPFHKSFLAIRLRVSNVSKCKAYKSMCMDEN